MTSQKADRHIFNCSRVLLVDNQQVGALVGALGVGLVPGGQQVGVTDQPIAAAREAQPAVGADGWRQDGVRGKRKKKNIYILAIITVSERGRRILCVTEMFRSLLRARLHM